jgi:hypothetical protein
MQPRAEEMVLCDPCINTTSGPVGQCKNTKIQKLYSLEDAAVTY